MKKKQFLSAFLSMAISMTSFAGVPTSVKAASVEVPAVTNAVLGVPTSSTTAVVTTAPPVKPYDDGKARNFNVTVSFPIRDYDTGDIIKDIDVTVYKGYDESEKVFSFNTGDDAVRFPHTFEYTLAGPDDHVPYVIRMNNIPEKYGFPDNSEGWMFYLDQLSAEKYADSVYNYNIDLHPIKTQHISGTVTGVTTTRSGNTTRPVTTTTSVGQSETAKSGTINFEHERYDLPVGSQYILRLNNPDGVRMDYEVEDRNIASERILYPTYVYVYAEMAGLTKVTAIGDNGEKAEAVINVYDPETTATTTTGTGAVTTTYTETTYLRSTPGAGMSFNDEGNSLYISPNETKTFDFSAYAARDVEFKADTDDIKIGYVDMEANGSLTPVNGKVEISCRYNAEPKCVTLYSYTRHTMTGEYFKNSHDLLIVPPEFTPTTTTVTGTATSVTTVTTALPNKSLKAKYNGKELTAYDYIHISAGEPIEVDYESKGELVVSADNEGVKLSPDEETKKLKISLDFLAESRVYLYDPVSKERLSFYVSCNDGVTTHNTTQSTIAILPGTTKAIADASSTSTVRPTATTVTGTSSDPHFKTPLVSGDSIPMLKGESRKIYLSDPMSGKCGKITFGEYSDNILVEYHEGDNFLIVTALKAGDAKINNVNINLENCPYPICITLTVTEGYADYRPDVNYEHTPLRVGETRKVYFAHPVRGKVKGNASTASKNIEVTYKEGDDFATVKALKEGSAEVAFSADGCAFSGYAYLTVVGEDADIIKGISANPDKIIYESGETPVLTGLKAKVSHADGTESDLDLSKLDAENYIIGAAPNPFTLFSQDQIKGGRYYIALGKAKENELTFGGKKYYFNKNDVSFPIYVSDDSHTYLELKNVKVTKANYGSDAKGLTFKGIDKAFRIDADSAMYANWSLSSIPFLKEGNVISGVLELNKAGTYVFTGDVFGYGDSYDANCDGEISMGDAVLIMQAIANPDKYGVNGTNKNHITSMGTVCGDADDDGMTNADALAIQKKLLKLA